MNVDNFFDWLEQRAEHPTQLQRECAYVAISSRLFWGLAIGKSWLLERLAEWERAGMPGANQPEKGADPP